MEKIQYEVGDMVFAAEDILNDGGMPGIEEERAGPVCLDRISTAISGALRG